MKTATIDDLWARNILLDDGLFSLATASLLGGGSIIELEDQAQELGLEVQKLTHQSGPVVRTDQLSLLVGSKSDVILAHKPEWIPAIACVKALKIEHDEVSLSVAERRGVLINPDSASPKVDKHTLDSLAKLMREEESRQVDDHDWIMICNGLAELREASAAYHWVEPVEPPAPPPPPPDPCSYEPPRQMRTARAKYCTPEELDAEAIARCRLLGIRIKSPTRERPIDSRGRYIYSGFDALRNVGLVCRGQHWRIREARENLMKDAYRVVFPDSENR